MTSIRDPAFHIRHHEGQQALRALNDAASLADGDPSLGSIIGLMAEYGVWEYRWSSPSGVSIIRRLS